MKNQICSCSGNHTSNIYRSGYWYLDYEISIADLRFAVRKKQTWLLRVTIMVNAFYGSKEGKGPLPTSNVIRKRVHRVQFPRVDSEHKKVNLHLLHTYWGHHLVLKTILSKYFTPFV